MNSSIRDDWALLTVFFIALLWVLHTALRDFIDKLIEELTALESNDD